MNRLMVCVKCEEIKEVVGFNHDDPILECGHVLGTTPNEFWDGIVAKVSAEIDKKIASGMTMEQAAEELAEGPEDDKLGEELERINMLHEEARELNALRFKR